MRSSVPDEATQRGRPSFGNISLDAGDRLQFLAELAHQVDAHGGQMLIGDLQAEVAAEDLAHAFHALAEEMLVGGVLADAAAGKFDHAEQRRDGERLAVDQHAVAVEDDQFRRHGVGWLSELAGEIARQRGARAVRPQRVQRMGEGLGEGRGAADVAVDVLHGEPGGGIVLAAFAVACSRSQFGSLGSMTAPLSVVPKQ